VEIMSEVAPEDILVIDRRFDHSKFAGSLPAVQRILEGVGSAQNIHLARLWSARRFILVEGKDLKLLRFFQDRLFPDSGEAFDAIPNMPIGGWTGWPSALGGSLLLQNAMGEDIQVYCVLDSDYHTVDEIQGRYRLAEEKGIQLHVWRMKEIENYLLVPSAIARVISKSMPSSRRSPKSGDIEERLKDICSSMQDETLDAMANEIHVQQRQLGTGGAIKQARVVLRERIEAEGITAVVSGKSALSALSGWAKGEFGVSLTAGAIARAMNFDEISDEVRMLVTSIEYGKSFGPPTVRGKTEGRK